jgi:hypothetical protein
MHTELNTKKPEGKRPIGRHMHRSVDIINMVLKEVSWDSVD